MSEPSDPITCWCVGGGTDRWFTARLDTLRVRPSSLPTKLQASKLYCIATWSRETKVSIWSDWTFKNQKLSNWHICVENWFNHDWDFIIYWWLKDKFLNFIVFRFFSFRDIHKIVQILITIVKKKLLNSRKIYII